MAYPSTIWKTAGSIGPTGMGYFKRGMFTGNANFYYTKWIDRSWPKSIYSEELKPDPDARAQSWKLPDYNLMDLHASYTLPGASFSNMKLRLHVFNLLDESYVSDADDGDGHAAASARVFLGLGRRWNISLTYDY